MKYARLFLLLMLILILLSWRERGGAGLGLRLGAGAEGMGVLEAPFTSLRPLPTQHEPRPLSLPAPLDPPRFP